ncbi:NAD(P)/FAD-dependent oxidoreductase [Corynebacterium comes]|uniref:Rhodocoxin reductase n=1 Tax=Corynebacterium comes TaxID=2675218 RepID=A0A6B8VDS3_9CORY|nr:FAD-dependent oxidoreductase [Corynebacterium comes]QGU03382.1 Rhodocoxin reductase [Corynebacterium comes]
MTTHTTCTLIIGGGEAALHTAAALRTQGYDDGIMIAAEEPYSPYQRPPLSKAFLTGEADEYSLQLRADDYYRDNSIDLRTGSRIAEVNITARGQGEAVAQDGDKISFVKVVLATGATPRHLTIPGAEADGVVYLRDIDSARRLSLGLADARQVVVIGGGFIGLEAAAAARMRGIEVTVLEAGDRLLGRVAAPPISEFYRQAHENRGATVMTRAAVTEIAVGEEGKVTGVILGDGQEIPADLVVVGIGVIPNTALAQQLNLECERGILVDHAGRTSHPDIYAAGDCTQQPHPFLPGELVCLESVQNAAAQGKIVAASIVGNPLPAPQVPWFWSDQGDLKLQIAGLSHGYDKYVLRGDPATESFSLLYYRRNRLIAVDAINQSHDFMAVKRALGKNATIDPERAGDTTVALKTLIQDDHAQNRNTVSA